MYNQGTYKDLGMGGRMVLPGTGSQNRRICGEQISQSGPEVTISLASGDQTTPGLGLVISPVEPLLEPSGSWGGQYWGSALGILLSLTFFRVNCEVQFILVPSSWVFQCWRGLEKQSLWVISSSNEFFPHCVVSNETDVRIFVGSLATTPWGQTSGGWKIDWLDEVVENSISVVTYFVLSINSPSPKYKRPLPSWSKMLRGQSKYHYYLCLPTRDTCHFITASIYGHPASYKWVILNH